MTQDLTPLASVLHVQGSSVKLAIIHVQHLVTLSKLADKHFTYSEFWTVNVVKRSQFGSV